jgi:RNA polymerase sigma factor, sigma-70 family
VSSLPPDTLVKLLDARGDHERASAWSAFLTEFSPVVLHACRNHTGDHDTTMDRYLFVIEALGERNCSRLRQYDPLGGAKFTTWLLVVSRRLCLDHYRARYGRSQSSAEESQFRHSERRQLIDLVGSEIGVDSIEGPSGDDPESILRKNELRNSLARALDELPVSDRVLLRFRFEDNLSVPEITRLTDGGSPFGTYRRLDKILARLRATLEAAGVSGPVP